MVLTAIMSLGALKILVDEVALREAEEGEMARKDEERQKKEHL